MAVDGDFDAFAEAAQPRLRRAFVSCRGIEGAGDAAAEALAFAWEHWGRVKSMENPLGYLYRVGQSRTRPRRPLALPPPDEIAAPDVEPGLIPALLGLPETQRTAVWLVHACGWPYREVAEAMGVSVTAVGTHVSRALERLRAVLEVPADV
jgi:DNA-directed RNA polymerase specialized sigma24 family protein